MYKLCVQGEYKLYIQSSAIQIVSTVCEYKICDIQNVSINCMYRNCDTQNVSTDCEYVHTKCEYGLYIQWWRCTECEYKT